MVKKIMAMGLSLCLALGGAAGLAEEASQPSALENAMAYMETADSLTIDAQFAIRQNGEDHVAGDALFQSGIDSQFASAVITHADGEKIDMELSMSGETCIIRIGDDFYSMPLKKDDADDTNKANDATAEIVPNTNPYLSTVVDQLFGSVADQITLSETGLSLHLAGDEVPAILNLAVSMLGGMADVDVHTMATESSTPVILRGKRGELAEDAPEEIRTMLSLGSKLHIDRVDLDVALEGEVITGIQFSIVLVGEGADGAVLETELAAVIRVTDVNATTPASVDLTNVTMQPLEWNRNRRGW